MYLSNGQATKGFIVQVAHALTYLENTPEAQQLLNRFGDIRQRLQEGQLLLDQTRGSSELLQDLKMRQKASINNHPG